MATITITLQKAATRVVVDSSLADCADAVTTVGVLLPALRLAGALRSSGHHSEGRDQVEAEPTQ